MRNEFELAFNEIKNQRALPQDVVLEALKTALISAYRRYSGASAAQAVDAMVDPATGRTRILVEKEVVDEVQNDLTEVSLEKARYYNPEAEMYDMVMVQVEGTTKKFGRIAAQTAKQVILQKIREAERNSLYDEYSEREGDIITGTVQNVNSNLVTLSLGRAEGVMPRAHQIPGERYKQHEKLRIYVVEVKKSNRGPQILVSRSHRNMLRRLLEFEVPEIYNGQVEIKSIAREAGYRSKVAVAALQEGVDPVGACVGMRGMRIQNIVKELHDEKIDVIEWNPDAKGFIAKALSPARVTGVYLDDDPDAGRTAVVIVPDDQLSLAIGREGQNARLAAKLTGWRIDIKSETEAVQSALKMLDREPLVSLRSKHATLIEEVEAIMAKRQDGRTIMPEEYQAISRFANISEARLFDARHEARQQREEEIEAVKMTLPEQLFEMPTAMMELPETTHEALVSFETVGDVMLRVLVDEKRVEQMVKDPEAFATLQDALNDMMMAAMTDGLDFAEEEAVVEDVAVPPTVEVQEDDVPAIAAVDELPIAEPEVVPEVVEPEPIEDPVPEVPEVVEARVDEAEARAAVEDEVVTEEQAAFPEIEVEVPLPPPPTPARPRKEPEAEPAYETFDPVDDDAIFDDEDDGKKKSKKKSKRKKRQLVYDEDAGRVVSKRKRKGSRARDDWDDFLG